MLFSDTLKELLLSWPVAILFFFDAFILQLHHKSQTATAAVQRHQKRAKSAKHNRLGVLSPPFASV